MKTKPIHLFNGILLGYIIGNQIHSRDGEYIGYVEENDTCWNDRGHFRGKIKEIDGNYYIVREMFKLLPNGRGPRKSVFTPIIPTTQINILPIQQPMPFTEGFSYTVTIK